MPDIHRQQRAIAAVAIYARSLRGLQERVKCIMGAIGAADDGRREKYIELTALVVGAEETAIRDFVRIHSRGWPEIGVGVVRRALADMPMIGGVMEFSPDASIKFGDISGLGIPDANGHELIVPPYADVATGILGAVRKRGAIPKFRTILINALDAGPLAQILCDFASAYANVVSRTMVIVLHGRGETPTFAIGSSTITTPTHAITFASNNEKKMAHISDALGPRLSAEPRRALKLNAPSS